MSDAPKFTVIDRRKSKAEAEERESAHAPAPDPEPAEAPAIRPAEPNAGPHLVVNESSAEAASKQAAEGGLEQELPPAPSAEEILELKAAYEAAAERLEEIIRAQNPAVGAQPPVTFEHLVQQFYISAMIQMGAGTQEGQRPKVDILGARTTINLMGVLAEKTKGNLTEAEDRTLQSVLIEVRATFMELTSMISLQAMQPPQPPPPSKR